ncbi:MAG: Prokaryotic family [Actinoplanes sp.]|jgi:hypothetical protein|nr:Prokaryotic family [Actinoplanes sp.]
MGRTIRINGVDVPVIADQLSGEEIKHLAGIDGERVLVRQDLDRNTIVPDAKKIRVAGGEVFTHHAQHSKAATITRRCARVRWEAASLAAAYPLMELAADESWLVIREFRLPAGWSPDRTDVMITPAVNYPECAPDGFYLASRLRRWVDGRLVTPGHYFRGYHNPHEHQGWYWYCLQDPAGRWDARQDSLLTFVEAIRTYLGAAD